MFSKYDVVTAEQIDALEMSSDFLANGIQFHAGDFLIKESNGNLTGMEKTEFDLKYRKAKGHSRRKKTDVSTNDTENTSTETGEVAEVAQAAEISQGG